MENLGVRERERIAEIQSRVLEEHGDDRYELSRTQWIFIDPFTTCRRNIIISL